jgi:hypothetical protein
MTSKQNSDHCAKPSLVSGDGASAPATGLGQGSRGVGRSAASAICFKCGGSDDLQPIGKSAPYLAPRLYLCPSCIKPRQTHKPSEEFDCGCAWNDERYVMLNPKVEHGSTVVARGPRPNCPACRGTGKIKDSHSYLGKKRSVGVTESERGRHGHTAAETEDEPNPIRVCFPDGGWQVWKQDWKGTTGRPIGRPKSTTHDLAIAKIYLADVEDETFEECYWMFRAAEDEELQAFLRLWIELTCTRAKSVNATVLAGIFGVSRRTIYRWRKRGQMLLNQLDRIEQQLKENQIEARQQWETLFARLYHVEQDEFEAPDFLPEQGDGTKP